VLADLLKGWPIRSSVDQIAQGLADSIKRWPIRSSVDQIVRDFAGMVNSLQHPYLGRPDRVKVSNPVIPARLGGPCKGLPAKSKAVPGSGVLGSEVSLTRPCKAVAEILRNC